MERGGMDNQVCQQRLRNFSKAEILLSTYSIVDCEENIFQKLTRAQAQKTKCFAQLWANVKSNSVINLEERNLIVIVTKTITYFKQTQQQIARYVKDNWGLPLITAFLILLFAAALLLAVGWASRAESIATAGYFAVAVDVLLRFVCFGIHRSKNGVVFDGSG
jgi:hypothetical protein